MGGRSDVFFLEQIWNTLRGVGGAENRVSITKSALFNVTIANGAAESEAFDISNFVGDAGLVQIPSAWTSAALGFKISGALSGTFSPLRDETGSVVQISGIITNAVAWYKLPDALRGALFVKLWSQTSGSNTNQGGNRSISISLKG